MQLDGGRQSATLLPALAAIVVTVIGSGCGDTRFEGFLSQPIGIDMPSAIPLIEVGFAGREAALGVVDSGSPLSVVFRDGDGSRDQGDLRLRENVPAERVESVGKSVVTRFIVRDVQVYDLPLAPLGLAPDRVEIDAIVGADLLSLVSVSLAYEQDSERGSLIFRDEIAATSSELAEDCNLCDLLKQGGFSRQRCNAVSGARRRGGGKVLIGGTERALIATRLVMGVCALPDAFEPAQATTTALSISGVPMAGLISTGLGVSVMAQSALERVRLVEPEIAVEDGYTLRLPYGTEPASLVRLERLAVVSSQTRQLGPCGELARRRRMLAANLEPDDEGRSGASIALAGDQNAPVVVAVIGDDSALFQGLRQELRPETADVDLLLGGSFLRFFESTLDYPASRIILRCATHTAGLGCETVPQCNEGGTPPCSDARGLSNQPCL